jgi:trans-aconitate 2-methyltransferase
MHRTPEPELMDAPDQALAYAQADFSSTDAAFVAAFFERFGPDPCGPVLDLGCGPGNICRRVARALPRRQIVGVDGAQAMLALGRSGAPPNLRFVHAALPTDALPRRHFAAIVSNSLLHHLHDPDVLWRAVADAGLPAAAVFVADLRRPASEDEVERLVAACTAGAPDVLRRDFRASLHAAFEVDEIRSQLDRCGLGALTVEPRGDRHVWIWGRLNG